MHDAYNELPLQQLAPVATGGPHLHAVIEGSVVQLCQKQPRQATLAQAKVRCQELDLRLWCNRLGWMEWVG